MLGRRRSTARSDSFSGLGDQILDQRRAEIDEAVERAHIAIGRIRCAFPAAAGAAFRPSLGRLVAGRIGRGGIGLFVYHEQTMNYLPTFVDPLPRVISKTAIPGLVPIRAR